MKKSFLYWVMMVISCIGIGWMAYDHPIVGGTIAWLFVGFHIYGFLAWPLGHGSSTNLYPRKRQLEMIGVIVLWPLALCWIAWVFLFD